MTGSDGNVLQFFSCIPPKDRHLWALRMSELLADDGSLVCLEFPTTKDPKLPGPPWALPPAVYMEHLSHPGEVVEYDTATGVMREDPDRPKPSNALSRIAHWQPARTHEIGKAADWISIWRH